MTRDCPRRRSPPKGRVGACFWKQWRKSKTRLRELKRLGIEHDAARAFARSGKGAWRLSKTSGVQRGLSNAHLSELGLFSLLEHWSQLASLRRTAQCGDRMLRWCGRGPQQCAPYPNSYCYPRRLRNFSASCEVCIAPTIRTSESVMSYITT